MGGHHPGMLGERGVPLGGARSRLVGEHVEAGADVAGIQRREQRRLVDHVTARGVHQDRAGLHRGQEVGVHEVLGLRRRRYVQAHHVGGGEQLRERAEAHHVELGQPVAGGSAAARAVQAADPHPEPGPPLGHGEADRAQADDAEGAAEQPVGLAVRRLRPAALPRVGHVVGDPAVESQDQAHGELGHRDRVAARHVGDQHPVPGRHLDVDGVGAGAGPDHQGEPVGGLEHRAVDLGAADHQPVDAGDPTGQFRGGQSRLHRAAMPPRLEFGDGLVGDRVGEQQVHGRTPLTASWCASRVPGRAVTLSPDGRARKPCVRRARLRTGTDAKELPRWLLLRSSSPPDPQGSAPESSPSRWWRRCCMRSGTPSPMRSPTVSSASR